MPNFNYVLSDASGKTVKGSVTAETKASAMNQVQANGGSVISMEESVLGADAKAGGMFSKKPKTKELAVFCRQFVSIEEAGVPVVQCLGMLAEQTANDSMRGAIQDCRDLIQSGDTLSEAMAQFPKVFPDMLVTLVEAGEASGSMSTSFLRMAEQFEKEARLQATMKKAGVYPCVVAVVAVAVVVLMLVFVIPNFEAMFNDMDTDLPAITVAVVDASAYLQESWPVVLAVSFAVIFGILQFSKSPMGQTFSSVMTLKLPLFRDLVTKTACARMARTLSTLLGSGLSIMEAIEITANTMTNLLFKRAIETVAEEVSMGAVMSVPLKEAGIFPPLVYHMVNIGEETGNVEKMLDTLAGYYEEEVEAATEALMALLEPVTIVILAVVVCTIIGAVMAPMATMYESLGSI